MPRDLVDQGNVEFPRKDVSIVDPFALQLQLAQEVEAVEVVGEFDVIRHFITRAVLCGELLPDLRRAIVPVKVFRAFMAVDALEPSCRVLIGLDVSRACKASSCSRALSSFSPAS